MKDLPQCSPYFDDILVFSRDNASHDADLQSIITRLTDHCVKINFVKSEFRKDCIDFLGYTINSNGVRPSQNKTRVLIDSPVPQTLKELRTLLGALGYDSRFVRNLSTLSDPLRKMFNDNELIWDPARKLRCALL